MEEKDTITINGKTIGVIVILLLLVGSTFGMFFMDKSSKSSSSQSISNYKPSNGLNVQTSTNLGEMPEKCRLPSGQNLESWKEHLGHHSETKECLQYFN